jgi:hypothetical protein
MMVFVSTGCGAETVNAPAQDEPAETPVAAGNDGEGASQQAAAEVGERDSESDTGTLQVRANGEDFIRQGFVTKDGWSVTFDHVYVTLSDLTAYQANPPYDAQEGGEIQAATQVTLDGVHTVDLAEGDEQAEPILVGEVDAPAGRYNALAWDMVTAESGPASGAVIMLQGNAEKADEQVDFTIRLNRETSHSCGDYVGDERKGLLEAGERAEVEATFHFDHLFGDGDLPADDALNTGAVGFDLLAELAEDGTLDADMTALRDALPADEYEKLETLHLAHVGEGHCTGAGH